MKRGSGFTQRIRVGVCTCGHSALSHIMRCYVKNCTCTAYQQKLEENDKNDKNENDKS